MPNAIAAHVVAVCLVLCFFVIAKALNYFKDVGFVSFVLALRTNCSLVSSGEWPDRRPSVCLPFETPRRKYQQHTAQANAAATTLTTAETQLHLAPTSHAVANANDEY